MLNKFLPVVVYNLIRYLFEHNRSVFSFLNLNNETFITSCMEKMQLYNITQHIRTRSTCQLTHTV